MKNGNYRSGFIIILVLALVCIVTSVTFYMQLSTTENKLALTEIQLSNTQTEITKTKSILDTTQDQLTTAHNELSSLQSSLNSTQAQLTTAQNSLIATQGSLAASLIQIDRLQTSLTATTSQVTALQSQLSIGHMLAGPIYASALAFITSDKTDQNTYNATNYNCVNFCADVIANAAKLNIRCVFINIDYPNTAGHTIIAFSTTDKGIVYIEPQTDELVQLKVGVHYYQSVIPKPGYHYAQPSYDDTVMRFIVVW